jgi:hydroxylaminobenzene mutase
MNRTLLRSGFSLILLALLGAAFIPAMALPRLGLSAHTVGVLGGVVLIAVGAVWPAFELGRGAARVHSVTWIAAGYLNWLGCLLGAVLGAGRATPIAAAGAVGPAWAEHLVSGTLLLAAAASLLAVGLALFGLRGNRARAS